MYILCVSCSFTCFGRYGHRLTKEAQLPSSPFGGPWLSLPSTFLETFQLQNPLIVSEKNHPEEENPKETEHDGIMFMELPLV